MSVMFRTSEKRRIPIFITLLFLFGIIFPLQKVNASSVEPGMIDNWSSTRGPTVIEVPADNSASTYQTSQIIKFGPVVEAVVILNMNPDDTCLCVCDGAEIILNVPSTPTATPTLTVTPIITPTNATTSPFNAPTPTPKPIQGKEKPSIMLSIEMFDCKTQKNTLYLGGTTGKTQKFGLIAPKGAMFVESFSSEKTVAVAQYVVRYGTSDPKVAGVTTDGVITAVKEGTCVITAVVELVDGTNRVFERTIDVKKASIYFLEYTDELRVGEKFTFKISLNGYRLSDIKWMSARRDGAVVGKNRGKLSAVVKGVSAKTDEIYIQVGDKVYGVKIKVVK